MEKKVFKIAFNHSPPFLNVRRVNRKLKIFDGFEYHFMETVSKLLNFTYELAYSSNDVFGSRLPDGHWNGLIGSVSRNETDIGLGGISMSADRSEVIDFVYPYYISPVTFVTKAPELVDNSGLLLVILPKQLWIAIIITILLFSLLGKVFRIKYQSFTYFHPVIKQGHLDKQSKTFKLFAIIFSWMFFRFILTTSYSEHFSSKMTLPLLTPLIRTFDELVKSQREGRIQVFANQHALYYQILQSKDSDIRMNDLIPSKGIKMTIEEIKKSKVNMAYISSTQSLIRYISIDPGSFYLATGEKARLMLDNFSVVLRKNFVYKKQFDTLTNLFQATGLFAMWRRKVQVKKSRIVNRINKFNDIDNLFSNGTSYNLSLKNLFTHFKLLFIGHGITLVVLMFENIFGRKVIRRKIDYLRRETIKIIVI